MHRCLEIPEILRLIFEYLSKECRKASLLILARTCKLFKDPALGVLWHTLESLEPLIYSLPHDAFLWKQRSSGRARLTRRLQFSDYGRIKENASRVRVMKMDLHFSKDQNQRLSFTKLFSGLEVLGPILPRVHDVSIDVNEFRDYAIYPRLIIGPHLRRIQIHLSESEDFQGDGAFSSWENIKVLTSVRPAMALEEFTLIWRPPSSDYKHDQAFTFTSMDVSELITSFPSMVTINALALQVQNPSFSLLASLQRLTTLAISVSSDDLLQFSKTSVGKYSLFQLVETLDLYVPDMNAAVHLLNLPGSFESLTSLTLRNSNRFPRDMLPLFQAMQKNSALCEHLKKLEVLARNDHNDRTPAPIISPANFSTFKPLWSLCNLRVLALDITGLAGINDAGLERIETLDLYVPDMNAVVHLFLNLPGSFESLTSLTLRNSDRFQRDMLPLFQAMQKNSALFERLKKLEVLASIDDNPAPIISPTNFSTFEPLSSLCNLRVLILDITGLAEINDAGLERVGVTLPRLETFVLAETTKRGFGVMPPMTLGGIVPFLTSCPQLQRLSLSVNASSPPLGDFSFTGELPRFPNLVVLNMRRSPITSPPRVAQFLALIFPNLARVSNDWDHRFNATFLNCWTQVNAMLGA
ncbi:hypothetical protein C0991_005171 [Blastosporella zonata]|nr:hypothetical protein C0991_005171 [Blastosporella zonata]